jgi:hypothetical protein
MIKDKIMREIIAGGDANEMRCPSLAARVVDYVSGAPFGKAPKMDLRQKFQKGEFAFAIHSCLHDASTISLPKEIVLTSPVLRLSGSHVDSFSYKDVASRKV